jgi:hypothetical protein
MLTMMTRDSIFQNSEDLSKISFGPGKVALPKNLNPLHFSRSCSLPINFLGPREDDHKN